MVNQRGISSIFIILGVILLIGLLAGFYNWNFQKENIQTQSEVILSNVENQANTDDLTNTWKTYQGKNFSFKYPSNYFITKDDGMNLSFSPSQTSPEPLFSVNLSKQSDWTKQKLCEQTDPPIDCLEREISKVTLDNKEARDIYQISGQGLQHIVQIDDPSLEIFYFLGDQKPGSEQDEVFKKILSTLTFTN